MKDAGLITAAVLLSIVLAACSTSGAPKTGSAEEVVVGGLFSSAFAGSSLSGADIDGSLVDLTSTDLGRQLTRDDKQAAATAFQKSLSQPKNASPVLWKNKANGVSGEVIPGAKYQVNDVVCRDYTHVVRMGVREEALRGSACQQADGIWKPIL